MSSITPKKIAAVVLLITTGMISLMIPCVSRLSAQDNYTVGNNNGTDHEAYLFSPFKFEVNPMEDEYRAHVSYEFDTSGQRYEYFEISNNIMPNPGPGECTITNFREVIGNKQDSLGVLLLSSHGNYDIVGVEAYDSMASGSSAMWQAYGAYIAQGPYTSGEISCQLTSTGFHNIAVTDLFIRNYGHLTQGLVYISACEGSSLADDFVYAGARVAVGDTLIATTWFKADRIRIFVSEDGRQGRPRKSAGLGSAGTAPGMDVECQSTGC